MDNGKHAKLTRWRPRKWEAMYEQIVILSTLGKSNVDLAAHFGYTPQHICNILASPEASLTRRRVLEVLRDSAHQGIDESMRDLEEQSIARLKTLMYDDELYNKSPFAVVDRGLQILKGVGRFKTGDEKLNVGKAVFIDSESAKILREGITKADEAKRLNDGGTETGTGLGRDLVPVTQSSKD